MCNLHLTQLFQKYAVYTTVNGVINGAERALDVDR